MKKNYAVAVCMSAAMMLFTSCLKWWDDEDPNTSGNMTIALFAFIIIFVVLGLFVSMSKK